MSTGRFPLLAREHRAPAGLGAPWRPWREDATPSLPEGLRSREHPLPAGVPSRARGESQAPGGADGGVAAPAGPPLDEVAGDAVGQCDWVLGGWAIPLLDDPANEALYLACGATWSAGLRYHVHTSSTCVAANPAGTQRLYIQNAAIVSEDTLVRELPVFHPADTGSVVARETALQDSSQRFSSEYIGFVDSTDGLTFPVYAPAYTAGASCGEPVTDSGATAYDTAGWTATAIPCQTPPADPDPDGDGTFVAYRDPTVLPVTLSDGSTVYAMLCVEGQSRRWISGTSQSFTAGVSGANPATNPRTRLVLFLCADLDFAPGAVYPRPGHAAEALVVLDQGHGKGGGVAPGATEWFGVPTAAVAPEGMLVVLVPWKDNRPLNKVPGRVAGRYPAATFPHSRPFWYQSKVGKATSGVSTFALDWSGFVTVIEAVWAEQVLGVELASNPSGALELLVEAGYQGEVLVTDGGTDTNDDLNQHPAHDVPIDPHLLACDENLFVYFDHEADQQWLDVAVAVAVGDWATFGIPTGVPDSLAAQGSYTVFERATCEHIVDLAGGALSGARAVLDPDVTVDATGASLAARFSTDVDIDGASVPGLVYCVLDAGCPTIDEFID